MDHERKLSIKGLFFLMSEFYSLTVLGTSCQGSLVEAFRQGPGSLPHSHLHLLGWEDLTAREGAVGLLYLREVSVGVNEFSS